MIIDNILFRDLLDESEKITHVAHVHPFVIYPILFKALFLGLLMPAIGYWLFPLMPEVWISWASVGAIVFTYKLIQWYMDAWIITNMSVINFQWNSPFSKSMNRVEFGTIENTTSEIHGFWGTIFRFGNIQIVNESSTPVTLKNVSRPQKLERIIMEAQSKYIRNQTLRDHGQLKDLLTSLLRSAQK